MSEYLVTGGCGFIGSHLCAALLTRGHGVRVLDDLSSGCEDNLPPEATLLRGDVGDADRVRAAMAGVAGCFHLAAIASVERGVRDWLGTHRANLTGAITVFDAARRAGPGGSPVPVVYASSAAVYGEVTALPITEDAPTRPLSAYGADKLGCEQHARAGGATHGLPSIGLRFFNVFGSRQDARSPYSGVISIFCDRLMRGEPVTVYGDGEQTRDFVHVSDVVAALLAGMHAASPSAPVVNVCSGRATRVLAMADTIAALCGAVPRIEHAAARFGEIRHSVGSPARARALLGIEPTTPLREGLAEVLDWLRAGQPRPGRCDATPAGFPVREEPSCVA
jgi:UDP-glucose 4-epimerase